MFSSKKKNVKVNVEKLKLQIEMVDHLLKYRFSWKDIEQGLGFSRAWYAFSKRLIEKHKN